MHAVAPPRENAPHAHGRHAPLDASANSPTPHKDGEHAVELGGAKKPTLHGRHTALPGAENVAAGHTGTHAEAPATDTLPAAQG